MCEGVNTLYIDKNENSVGLNFKKKKCDANEEISNYYCTVSYE